MRSLSIVVSLLVMLAELSFAGRYYDARTGRFLQIDPKAHKFPGWSPYNYAANNPLKYIDPDGKELIKVVQGSMNVIVDKKIASNVNNFLKAIQDAKLPVSINNSFRTTDEQQKLYDNSKDNSNPVAKPGTSRHESGFAIDLNGVGNLTKEQKETLNKAAKDNNFSPLDGDPPHFEADPTDAGYKDRKSAIDENQKDYKDKKGTIPEYKPDKKDEKKEEKEDDHK
jgi:uncharacterized protein RhaS with RHS repeats